MTLNHYGMRKNDGSVQTTTAEFQPQAASLANLYVTWAYVGAMSWGGLYANLPRIEALMVRRGWLPPGELTAMLPLAFLVPGPSFVSLAGLIGHRLRRWPGALLSLVGILTVPALLVLTAVMLISPAQVMGPLGVMKRMVALAVTGILFGSARRQVDMSQWTGGLWWPGRLLALGIIIAVLAGLSPALAVVAGLVVGSLLWVRSEAK